MAAPETPSSTGGSQPPPLVARGLTRRYGPRAALDGIDLELAHGEFLTLFGPNGAGKTTLLKCIASLVRPTSGTLSVFGHDADEAKRRIGLVGHEGFLYGGLSGRNNLIFYAGLYDLPDARERVAARLSQVGLTDRADDSVNTYSRGMKQRLTIARALIHDPDLVLLDEPYTGLDQHAARMFTDVLETVKAHGRSVVMVTHQLEEGLRLGSRVAIMDSGRVVFDRPADDLTRDQLEKVYHETVQANIS